MPDARSDPVMHESDMKLLRSELSGLDERTRAEIQAVKERVEYENRCAMERVQAENRSAMERVQADILEFRAYMKERERLYREERNEQKAEQDKLHHARMAAQDLSVKLQLEQMEGRLSAQIAQLRADMFRWMFVMLLTQLGFMLTAMNLLR
ncbi:hypothetical protein [Pseudoduganella violacea]|uniref:DUF1640 domain-containing protein n=1 Tax=Pseudoduganella violacea TaxID=1715466 RepID=A0A7W5FT31_9BURK|nr:hypothetical protein [Pseudoduganella violacea]MBB3118207.1 hypothetical protein [Pseudoduganella violacea]